MSKLRTQVYQVFVTANVHFSSAVFNFVYFGEVDYGQTVLLSSLVLSLYITVSVYVNYMNKCCLKREGNSLLKQNKDLEYDMKYYYIISPQKYKMLILFSPAV